MTNLLNAMENKNKFSIDFVILGISFIIGVIIFTAAWKSNQKSNQTIALTVSAKKEIVSDYGINDLSSIEKEVVGVVTASFQIE